MGLDWQVFFDEVMRLGIAAILGGVLGFEREWKGHWAGLRTHIMVSMGSALFVIAGMELAPDHLSDTTRVIQGVASGIGFLGAGTILKLSDQREIKGLTTASSIWLASAIGIACGLGEFGLAGAAAVTSLFVLAVLQPVEAILDKHIESFNNPKDKKPKSKE